LGTTLQTLAALQRGFTDRCATTPLGLNPRNEVLQKDTAAVQLYARFWSEGFVQENTASTPAAQQLTRFQHAWDALSSMQRLQLMCYDHQMFQGRFNDLLWTAVEERAALPELEAYLTAVTDTSVYNDAAIIAAAAAKTPLGRRLYAQAVATGDPHRYDAQLGSLDDLHSNFYGARNQQLQIVLLKAKTELALGHTDAAARSLAQADAWSPLSATYWRIDLALQQHDTTAAIRALALCRLTNPCIAWHVRDSATKTQLDALYRATHHGSLDGLDTVEAQACARPELELQVPITPWHRPATTGEPRVSVLQLDSWVGCPPCAMHTLAAHAVKRRFGDAVIVLTYNYLGPLVPPNYSVGKSTALPEELWRRAHPKEVDNDTVPARIGIMTDGDVGLGMGFGGPLGAPFAYEATSTHLEERLLVPPQVRVQIQPNTQGNHVTAFVQVTRLTTDSTGHPLTVHVLLVEDPVWIVGVQKPSEDGVVRAVAGDSATGFGLPLSIDRVKGAAATVIQPFDIAQLEQATQHNPPNRLNANDVARSDFVAHAFHFDRKHLSIVAYVQDQATGEILQGAQVPIYQ